MPKHLNSKLGKIVFEAHKIGLNLLKLILVRLEVHLLLLADLLPKVYLLESVRKLLAKGDILLVLLGFIMRPPVSLHLVDKLNLHLELVVANFEVLDLLFKKSNFFICLVLSPSERAVLEGLIK